MRVYLSGPINSVIPGVSKDELVSRFYRAEAWISANRTEWGFINPLSVGACEWGLYGSCGAKWSEEHSWECYLRYDLKAMLGCDGIVLLPGWQQSRGAKLENFVASSLGFEKFRADSNGVVL